MLYSYFDPGLKLNFESAKSNTPVSLQIQFFCICPKGWTFKTYYYGWNDYILHFIGKRNGNLHVIYLVGNNINLSFPQFRSWTKRKDIGNR